jgi:neutral ceramidase
MKNKATSITLLFSFLILLVVTIPEAAAQGWRAGVEKMIITPDEPIWMAGYGGRDRPSEGVLHDLWAKALAIEDLNGNQAVLVTTDLLGFPQKMSNRIRDRIERMYGLSRSQIILSSSHTHTGPVLMDALFDIYPLEEEHLAVIKKYSDDLENKIVYLVGEALNSMVPANLFSENGVVRFGVNRRNNSESTLIQQTELKGPNDYAVPVLKVENNKGQMLAVVFGYACHTTTLGIYEFSGDYAGFAQIEVEKSYPGTTAMFFMGAGADINPMPRRTIPLAQQYGRELAAAVSRVLQEEMSELEPSMVTTYSELELKLSPPPSIKELTKIRDEGTGYQQRWAANQLKKLQEEGSLISSYPYPIQIWNLGHQVIAVLGGELVIEYAIELKKLFGHGTFVVGYANDVMAYIPSETILEEGRYEGESSQMVYGMPGTWEPGLQKRILNGFLNMAEEAGINQLLTGKQSN